MAESFSYRSCASSSMRTARSRASRSLRWAKSTRAVSGGFPRAAALGGGRATFWPDRLVTTLRLDRLARSLRLGFATRRLFVAFRAGFERIVALARGFFDAPLGIVIPPAAPRRGETGPCKPVEQPRCPRRARRATSARRPRWVHHVSHLSLEPLDDFVGHAVRGERPREVARP